MKTKRANRRIKQAWDDRIFDICCNLFLTLFVIIVFYPIYFVVVASFTEPTYVNSGALLLYPKEFTLSGYKAIFAEERVWSGYFNTILYTLGGTVAGTAAVVMAGYAFSRKDLPGAGLLMKLYVFTMYFGGGTIPLFLVVRRLGLVDTRAIMFLLGCVSTYNIIVVRSFMQSNIPEELYDAAIIDGCGQGKFFLKVVLPLSKAVVSVIVMYIAVGYWNSYFNAMIFLTDAGKYPLQMYLREILLISSISATNNAQMISDPEYARYMQTMAQVVKYSIIVVSTAPIICVYPFIQKYFVKGVMIGSMKG